MTCHCGETALFRVGKLAYCLAHKAEAIRQIERFGMPRKRKGTKRSVKRVMDS